MLLTALLIAFVTSLGPADHDVGTRVPLICDASGGIQVPVSIGGSASRPFVLDTGASLSAVDVRDAERLGLAPAGSIPSAGSAARLVNATFVLGSGAVFSTPVVAADLKSVTSVFAGVGGILGSDVLRMMGTVTIDYERCTLTISRAPSASSSARISLEWHEGRPVIPVRGGGRLLLDSGATTVMVFDGRPAASLLRWSGPPSLVRIDRVGGGKVGRLGRLESLTIGTVELQNVPAVGVRSWYDKTEKLAPDGLLPLGLFSRVLLDYQAGFAVLIPPSH